MNFMDFLYENILTFSINETRLYSQILGLMEKVSLNKTGV